jgi:hypothetical protein
MVQRMPQSTLPSTKPGDPAENERDETRLERLDRNLIEMLGELRVAQTGVQILFAFLLVLPFNTRFARVGGFGETVYVVTLLLTGASAGLLIAPSALHRMLFRRSDKEFLVFRSNTLMLAGLWFLALAISGAVLLVIDFVWSRPGAFALAGATLLYLVWLWFGHPLGRRRELED